MATSRTHKTLGVAFGAFLVIIAVVIALLSVGSSSIGPIILASVLGVLGLDQVVSTLRERTSIIERIGPLP